MNINTIVDTQTLEKNERKFKYGQSRNTGTIRHKTQDDEKQIKQKTKINQQTKDETNKQKTSTTKEISDTDCVIKTPGYPGAGKGEDVTASY